MIVAMLQGNIGPGQGWFHPGRSRYGWDWLAARYDANGDGTVTPREFKGPTGLFARLDRNRDGVLTRDDFDWSDRALASPERVMAAKLFFLLDADSNGRVSRQEWDAFFARIAGAKGYVNREDLAAALQSPAPRPSSGPAHNQGPSLGVLLSGLFSGELGSFNEGPRVGQVAPDFRLKTHDGAGEIRLSQFRGKKPVVLVFGSFT